MDELRWEALEYEDVERSALWYVGLGFVATSLALIALWQNNFLFAIFVVVAALVVAALSKERPPMRAFLIDGHGFSVDGTKVLPFERLRGFSTREPGGSEESGMLVIHSRELLHHTLHISIPRARIAEARALLGRRLKEIPHDDSLLEEVLKILKF